MTAPAPTSHQQEIAKELQVGASFEAATEIERRVAFLAAQLTGSDRRALVLGISGGVDSTVAGQVCRLAAERVREAGREATFIAMRLPYGVQADERDARLALEFIRPDRVMTVDVKPASDVSLESVLAAGLTFRDERHQDFVLGNVKARQRMIVQYTVANAHDGLVVGTDQAAEAISGFYTKYGDGAADVVPLAGLTKRRVRAVGEALGALAALMRKVPTADLETLNPGVADEDVLGVSYDTIDDFLEGEPVDDAALTVLIDRYRLTEHKRRPPITP